MFLVEYLFFLFIKNQTRQSFFACLSEFLVNTKTMANMNIEKILHVNTQCSEE